MKILAIPSRLDTPELELFIGLRKAGFHVDLIADPFDYYVDRLNENNISVTKLLPKSRFDKKFIEIIKELYNKNQYDIVHTFSSSALSNAIFALKNQPCKILGYRGTVGHISRLNPLMYLTYLNSRLDMTICVSNAVKNYLHQSCKIPLQKLTTIYKGHDSSSYKGFDRDKLLEYGVPISGFVVCLAANMRPVKGVKYLLEAFDLLSEYSDIHLMLVGRVMDSKIAKRIEQVKRKENLHQLGFHSNSVGFIGASDLFIMPSIEREGLPKALIEAMSLGIPVIATKVGGMVELVEDNVNGLLIPPKDSVALSEAILKLYKDHKLRADLAVAGKRTIDNQFNVELMVKKTIDVYKALIEK